ncbi:MAG: ferrous iron transport protein A [Planctomycetes bacterium]|nr:ferrous iron transport protein A [Planctomycetota bacterium]
MNKHLPGAASTPRSGAHGAKPLAMVEAGKRVRLKAIQSGRELQARLAAMGLTPGIEIEVIRNQSGGPCIVAVRGSRIMLGRGMAHGIIVG